MRSLLSSAAILVAIAGPALAAPAHVQSFSGNVGSAASVSFALPAAIASGDTFVGAVFEESSSNIISSIKDDKGNTYPLLDLKQVGTSPYFVQTFALANIVNSPQTITVTFSSTPTGGVQYLLGDEYSGIASIDAHNLTYTASGTSFPSGSVTLTGTNDMLWTAAAPGSGVATIPAGYTARVSDASDGLFSADLAYTGTGAYPGASYTSAASQNAVVGIVGLVPFAPAPSIDLSDGSHLAPSINGDVVGVGSNGAFALVPAPSGGGATVAVGTTTTGAAGSNASVTNSGTNTAAVFNFTIPQGIQGNPGQNGTNAGQNTYPACPAPTDPSTVGNSEFCSANGHTDIAVSPAANTWVYFGPAQATAP